MANLLNNGRSTRGKDNLRFADGVDRTSSDVDTYQASPEYLAELEKRLQRKYRNEPPPGPQRPRIFMPEPKPRKTMPAERSERVRRRYIECRAYGMNRTQTLEILREELGISDHTVYKLLKTWGYRNLEVETAAINEFCRNS